MINIIFDVDLETFRLSLIVKGHANFDEVGKDIVCASASILTYTIAKIATDMVENGRIAENSVIRLKEGEAFINCHCMSKEAFAELSRAFRTIETGYKLLAENYPQNIDVTAL